MMIEMLEMAGPALYGPRWKSDLARDLGVSNLTVATWLRERRLPARVPGQLLKIVRERAAHLSDIGDQLDRATGRTPEEQIAFARVAYEEASDRQKHAYGMARLAVSEEDRRNWYDLAQKASEEAAAQWERLWRLTAPK